jgi:hypothetical protein
MEIRQQPEMLVRKAQGNDRRASIHAPFRMCGATAGFTIARLFRKETASDSSSQESFRLRRAAVKLRDGIGLLPRNPRAWIIWKSA